MSKIIYCVVVVIFLIFLWLHALKEWRDREAETEMRFLEDVISHYQENGQGGFEPFENSLFVISKRGKRGKHLAFEFAYRIGKEEGRKQEYAFWEAIRKKDLENLKKKATSSEKGGADNE